MKKIILTLLTLSLIACGNSGTGRGGSSGSNGGDNVWLGELKVQSTRFLESYNLCGNTSSNIKKDALAYGIVGLLTGTLDWRNTINNGLGIAFNRGIIQNCGRIDKIVLALWSYQPYLPEGESVLFMEPVQITRWNYNYGSQRANDYQKLDNFIQAGAANSGDAVPRLIFHQTEDQNTTQASVNSHLWYQKEGSRNRAERLQINRRLDIKTWRISSNTQNKDIGIEIRQAGTLIGTSTLNFGRGYYSQTKPNTQRQVASFISNLKNHSLLLGLATGLIFLIIAAVLIIPRMQKEN